MQVDQALHEATVAVDLEKPATQEVKKEDKLMSIGQYARELRSSLPKDLLKPTPLRLIPFLSLVILAVVSASALVSFQLGIVAKVGLGLVIGYCFGAIAFMAHEILHGSVVRNRLLQDVFGFIGFAPFLIAPTFWRYWHNRLHHGHTQKIIKDPDAFPTQRIFKQSNYMKRMYKFTPGSGYLRSYFYFFFWFFFLGFF